MIPIDDCANHLHARHACNVADNVVQLQVHLHQGLLHVLDVRCRIIAQTLLVPQVGPDPDDRIPGPKACPEQPMFVQLLEPLSIVDVGLPSGHVLGMTGVHQQHLQPGLFENLEHRNPVHARRLHRDRPNSNLVEPIGQSVQIRREALKRAYRFIVPVR